MRRRSDWRGGGIFLLIGVCWVFFSSGLAVCGGDLRGAAGRVDITPSIPVTMAGYSSRKEVSRGVHDPLSIRVVVFEEGGRRLVLVSVDLLGFYGGTAAVMRKAILSGCGLGRGELFLSATHTHSGPTVTLDTESGHTNNVRYTRELEGKLVEAVRRVLEEMGPIAVGFGRGSSPVGANRRKVVYDEAGESRIVLGRNPDAVTDREVQVLAVRRGEGGDREAVVFGYATHSTALGPGNYLVSGDVHGLAAQFIEGNLGGGVVAPAFAGASGNIDPWYRVLPGFRTEGGWIPEPVLLGTMLGEEVIHVLAGIDDFRGEGPVRVRFESLALPVKPRRGEEESAGGEREFNLTVGRVGEVAFVGLGGEVFNEIGQAIKSASPFGMTFIMTQCNGAAGYLPTRSSYPEGGYEVESSPFAPGADEAVIAASLRLLRELRGE